MTEVEYLALPKTVKRDLKIGRSRASLNMMRNFRPLMSTNLPFCFRGATPPRPDPTHTPSVVGGVFKRFGYGTPQLNRKLKRRFGNYVKCWLKHNFVPLTDADIPSFEEWLTATPYSEGRKAELREEWSKFQSQGFPFTKFREVKSFIKDETYPEFKYPRIINSRIDAAKCYFGPVVQAVSDRLFSRPEFIKTVPVPDRPKVIRDTLLDSGDDEDYVFTDYTSFEAHFVPEVMEVTQFLLFEHALSHTQLGEWLQVYKRTMGGINAMQFKSLSAQIMATRMSGEMDTSLSNGFANLMLFNFVCKTKNATSQGFVEGDDGIFRVTPARSAPTAKDFEDLGFTIKIEHTPNLSEASFCGQVYDMTDLIVVTDPVEVLARLGWTNKKYVQANDNTRMQLLRAKAFSLVYQYNGCPLLDTLGRRLLDLTAHIQISPRIYANMDLWERDKLRAATTMQLPAKKEPGANTRALVERLYGVSVDKQRELEKWFASIDLGTHQLPFIAPESWQRYYHTYSIGYQTTDPSWLNKNETPYLKRIKSYKAGVRFVASL